MGFTAKKERAIRTTPASLSVLWQLAVIVGNHIAVTQVVRPFALLLLVLHITIAWAWQITLEVPEFLLLLSRHVADKAAVLVLHTDGIVVVLVCGVWHQPATEFALEVGDVRVVVCACNDKLEGVAGIIAIFTVWIEIPCLALEEIVKPARSRLVFWFHSSCFFLFS